jgi:hypothetical protein
LRYSIPGLAEFATQFIPHKQSRRLGHAAAHEVQKIAAWIAQSRLTSTEGSRAPFDLNQRSPNLRAYVCDNFRCLIHLGSTLEPKSATAQ